MQAGVMLQRTEIRSAPLPDPDELARYQHLDPALYELIKGEFAKNGEHRRQIEQRESKNQRAFVSAIARNDTLGMVLSWIFAVGCAGGAFAFIWLDRPVGAVVGVLGVLPSVIAQLRGSRRKSS